MGNWIDDKRFAACMTAGSMAIASGLLACGVASAQQYSSTVHPASLVNMAPVSDTIQTVDRIFKTKVILGSGVDREARVAFVVRNTAVSGSRAEAVADIARQIGARETGYLVISKAAKRATGAQALDTSVKIDFPTRYISADRAIKIISEYDRSIVVNRTHVTGYVTLSSSRLPATVAANEVARQTHTRWAKFYKLTSSGMYAHRQNFTPNEQAITEQAPESPAVQQQPTSEMYTPYPYAPAYPYIEQTPASPGVLFPPTVWAPTGGYWLDPGLMIMGGQPMTYAPIGSPYGR